MESLIWLAPICAVVALLFAAYKTAVVSKAPGGNDRMQEIASAISEGARAFLYSEYKILAIFIVVVFVLIGLFISWETGICFVVGAVFSICAGFFGMNVATKANVRTAQAAMDGGMNKALGVAFSGGSVMGMCVVGLGLLGASVIYIISEIPKFCLASPGCFLHCAVRACRRRYLHQGGRCRCRSRGQGGSRHP